jgi:hypothetical protein
MLCETCRWSGRPGFVRVVQTLQQSDHCELIPCPDCGGQGIAHCCDGICEQPNVEPLIEPIRRPPTANRGTAFQTERAFWPESSSVSSMNSARSI